MSETETGVERRTVLQLAAGMAAASLAAGPARAGAKAPAPTGKPGDFDFLTGTWTIHNRRLVDGRWTEFPGASKVYRILDGVGSVEELLIPADKPLGLGLRLLDGEKKLWADYWVPARTGVLTPPPYWGSFADGTGIWDGDDKEGDKPIIVRGMWHEITANSCRWTQTISRDDGKTWNDVWQMKWTRAAAG
jgi:hypothetical protein